MKGLASIKISLVLIVIIVMAVPTKSFGYTIYVDSRASGANIGTDWNNALRSLQDAIFLAYTLPKPVEIRVARGVYRPDQGEGIARGDREMPFFLLNGVAIKGGYAGRSYSNPDARDVKRYETVLSGDLLGNDSEVDYAWNLVGDPNRFDNSMNIVVAYEVGETAVLDGFIISGGYANDSIYCYGAGMFSGYASPTIIDCIFEDNFAGQDEESMGDGAGMSNYYSNPTLMNCTFRGNCVGYNGFPNIFFAGVTGGGFSSYNGNPVLTDCVFDRNVSFDAGGAIADVNSSVELANCTFNANTVFFGWGGAMLNYDSNVVMNNCLFTLNYAPSGGAVNSDSSIMIMTNCTFAGNFGLYDSSGFWCDSFFLDPPSSLDFTNCILWDGEEQILNDDDSEITIRYSDVQGGWSGIGENNMDTDPLFAELAYWVHIDDPDIILEPDDPNAVQIDGDYHLKSQEGRWDPISRTWVQDDITSPCIDAGDPDSLVGDESEPNGDRINLGAFGGTSEASRTP
jgi:hypothetical protein